MIAGWWEEEEKEETRWERRERVLSATLSARMRVEQRQKRDRTRRKVNWEDGSFQFEGFIKRKSRKLTWKNNWSLR